VLIDQVSDAVVLRKDGAPVIRGFQVKTPGKSFSCNRSVADGQQQKEET